MREKVKARAILVRPLFDKATSYSHLWAQRLISEVNGDVELTDLTSDNATRERVERALVEDPEADFIFYDHGDEEGLIAQGGTIYVIDSNNVNLLRDRVVYTLACLWGKKGGAEAWRRGAKVVVCYIDVFVFTPYDEELFCRAVNSGYIAYVRGERDWNKIKEVMLKAFDEAISKAQDPWTKLWLWHDKRMLRIYAEGVDYPETKCVFRMIAIKIFGPRVGWSIKRIHALSFLLFGAGLGVYVHDRIAEWAVLGHRLHGIDVGVIMMVIAWAIIAFDLATSLMRPKRRGPT